MLVTARARQLAFVDLAGAATAALAQPEGKHSPAFSCDAHATLHAALLYSWYLHRIASIWKFPVLNGSYSEACTEEERMTQHAGCCSMQQGSPVPNRHWNIAS